MTNKSLQFPSAQAAGAPHTANVFLKLLPITVAVFMAFLTIGIQLPVLPLHLHDTLGMGPTVIGLVVGAQFFAALLSRAWAGNFADVRGGKRAVVTGFLLASASGLVYLASLAFTDTPAVSVWILVGARVMLALAESLITTGTMSWGIGLVGPQNGGKVMAWLGMAIFAAYALGAPVGVTMNNYRGFAGIAVSTVVIPLIAAAFISGMRALAPTATSRTPFYKVLGAVWLPGLGLAFCSVGFGVIAAFIALLFASKGWGSSSLAFSAFGAAFIAARIFFGHLPDKLGGARVALVCVVIEAVGQLLIWNADAALLAYFGAALTGFGYSLAFPGFGVEAMRRAPPQTRGLAMGAYVAFLDIALGITSPLAGVLASAWGVRAVYLAGAVSVSLSFLVALVLLARKQTLEKPSRRDATQACGS